MADKPTGLTKPAGAAPAGPEPVIHVIPEKFYGAALKQKAPPLPGAPAAIAPPAPAAPVDANTQAAAAAAVSGNKPPAKKKPWLMIGLIAAVVLLIGGGAAAFFLLRSAPPVVVNQSPVVNEPAAPVCGDGACNPATESAANCSADCKPAAAACGDAKCDATETYASCASDCPAPAAVCGDSKCDAGETPAACPADCRPPEAKPGSDLDSDGLSDQEETEVFGTNVNDPNTDHDSFVDLNETLNLFDPATPSPTVLRDNPKIGLHVDAANGVNLLYPKAWTVKAATATDPATIFSAPSGETITLTFSDKPAAQALMDWYLGLAPGVTSSQVEPYKTRAGNWAVLSPDRMTAYVDLGAKGATIAYKLGNAANVQYRVTFQTFVQSLTKQ